MKLINSMSEYFTGKTTRDDYKYHKGFLKENILEPDLLKEHLRIQSKKENLEIILGKVVPNILTGVGVYCALTYQMPYLILNGEVIRAFMLRESNRNRKDRVFERRLKQRANQAREVTGLFEDFFKKLKEKEDEGEEWKGE